MVKVKHTARPVQYEAVLGLNTVLIAPVCRTATATFSLTSQMRTSQRPIVCSRPPQASLVPHPCNSIAYHHLCLRASIEVFCAVADHVKSHSMQEGSGCYSSIAEDQSMSCWSAVDALKERVDLKSIGNLVITHLTPKRLPSLKAFLQERAGQGSLSIHLSNPALQLLRSTFGEHCCCHPDCQVDLPSQLRSAQHLPNKLQCSPL